MKSLSNKNILMKVKRQHENTEYIDVPSFCDLIEGQTYSVHCSEADKVQPEVSMYS